MRSSRFLMISGMCLLLGAGSALAQGRPVTTYSNIDPPGATWAIGYGINAGGDIVGTYKDANNVQHGFLKPADGDYRTIDYPGAKGTDARGIGPSGEILGNYWLAGESAVGIHGYLLTTDGLFVNVDAPGHTNLIAQKIMPNGMILGCRHDADQMGTMRGIVIGDGVYEELGDWAFASMNNGATEDLRMIVGFYNNSGTTTSYTIVDGVPASFMIEGSSFTQAWDVNPQGEIVGVYRIGVGAFHGFVLRGDAFTDIYAPGASQTRAFGINPPGNVVGYYVSGGVTHAFLAIR